MFVPLYSATGTLTSPLRKAGSVFSVTEPLSTALHGLGNDYTYVRITGKAGVEIVKVRSSDLYGIYIDRGIDYTEPLNFNVGDRVDYTLTAAEILDSIPQVDLDLSIGGALVLNGAKLTYTLPVLSVVGASEIRGDYPNIEIGRTENAYGCCDGTNEPETIPLRPFYLTSQPYPSELIECLTFTGDILGGTTRKQPHDELTFDGSILENGTLRTILQQLPTQPFEAVTFDGSVGFPVAGGDPNGGTLIQILKSLPPQPFEAVTFTGDILPVGGVLTKILQSYTYWPSKVVPDESMTFTGDILSGAFS